MAVTLPNLALKVWNAPTDAYNSAQLAQNWYRIDEHDHSPGKGRPLAANALADYAVTTLKLADGSVTTAKLADGAIATPKLADGVVTADKIVGSALDALGLTSSGAVRRGFSTVAASESTNSSTAVDLTTVGPAVSVTVPTGGLVLAVAACDISGGNGEVALYDGATLVASSMFGGGSTVGMVSALKVLVPSAGTKNYKLKYASSNGVTSVSFANRRLWVWTVGF